MTIVSLASGPSPSSTPITLRVSIEGRSISYFAVSVHPFSGFEAGFKSVSIETFDQLIGGNDVDQTLKLAFRLGPLGAAVREHPHLAEATAAAVRQVLEQHLTPDGVMMPAAVWIVRARNG